MPSPSYFTPVWTAKTETAKRVHGRCLNRPDRPDEGPARISGAPDRARPGRAQDPAVDHGQPVRIPSARDGRPLFKLALLQLMRGLGYGVGGDRGDAVPHGFRSAFRDWAGEVSNLPARCLRNGLCPRPREPSEAAYRRADLCAKRHAMM